MITVQQTEKYFIDNNPVLVIGKVYFSTDKKRLKVGSGARWSVTDYVPVQFIIKSSGAIGHHWIVTMDDTGMLSMSAEDLGI